MKPDEYQFMLYVLEECDGEPQRIREYINGRENPKRFHYILSKWDKKHWYEYGVCLDLDWLTDEGKKAISQLKAVGLD